MVEREIKVKGAEFHYCDRKKAVDLSSQNPLTSLGAKYDVLRYLHEGTRLTHCS